MFLTSWRRSKFREMQYAFLNGPKQFLSKTCKNKLKETSNQCTALSFSNEPKAWYNFDRPRVISRFLPLNVAKHQHMFCIYTANLHGLASSADPSVYRCDDKYSKLQSLEVIYYWKDRNLQKVAPEKSNFCR